ncbi:MAG: hypothetical protein EP298_10580 [Gammaproteobacteria bacterium]|nr:MAG: hypothetical protein EP298_10580 [Gammaproteobacteria bacterium]UTW42215.1 hypothetical protein KFE69_12095 [bacterium SCSIO 12844]
MPKTKIKIPRTYAIEHTIGSVQEATIGEKPGQRYYNRLEGDRYLSAANTDHNNLTWQRLNMAYIKVQQLIQKDQFSGWDERNRITQDEYENLTDEQQLQLERLHAIKDGVSGYLAAQKMALSVESDDFDQKLSSIEYNRRVASFAKSEDVTLLADQKSHFDNIISFYSKYYKESDGALDFRVSCLFKKECGLLAAPNIDLDKYNNLMKNIRTIQKLETAGGKAGYLLGDRLVNLAYDSNKKDSVENLESAIIDSLTELKLKNNATAKKINVPSPFCNNHDDKSAVTSNLNHWEAFK